MFFLEIVADCVDRISLARCRQANKKRTGSDANNIKHLISGLMAHWGLAFLKIERCLPSLFCKSKKDIPFMYKALGKAVIKSEKMLPHFSVEERGCAPKSGLAKGPPCILYKPKPICQSPISSAFACCRRPWLCASCPATPRTGGCKPTCFPFPLFLRVYIAQSVLSCFWYKI